jgi:hypothetical protein
MERESDAVIEYGSIIVADRISCMWKTLIPYTRNLLKINSPTRREIRNDSKNKMPNAGLSKEYIAPTTG